MRVYVIYSIILGITIISLLVGIFGKLYFRCGESANPTCYGRITNMTLIYKNRSLNDTLYAHKYIFENKDKIIETSNYEQSICLYLYDTRLEELIIGNVYPVYYAKIKDTDETASGKKLSIYRNSAEMSYGDGCTFEPLNSDYIIYLYIIYISPFLLVVMFVWGMVLLADKLDAIEKRSKSNLIEMQSNKHLFSQIKCQEEGKTCSICLSDFKLRESYIELKCQHIFHKPCIYTWLNINNTCPVCRKVFNMGTKSLDV